MAAEAECRGCTSMFSTEWTHSLPIVSVFLLIIISMISFYQILKGGLPNQMNGSDCGVLVCAYAKYLLFGVNIPKVKYASH